MRWLRIGLLLTAACTAPAESPLPPAAPVSPRSGASQTIVLSDISDASGIRFSHEADRSQGRRLPETMGAGAAFFDYDGDGRPDLYLVNGGVLGKDRASAPSGKLYRNVDGQHFEEVTAAAGLTQPFYGMGAAVGDFDNDGLTDLFVTGVGGDHLFHNRGGRFVDITSSAGIEPGGFSSSAAFLDYDNDGDLDLFVGRYVVWSPDADRACQLDGKQVSYCTPEMFPSAANRFYRNQGRGRFEDVTEQAFPGGPAGKTLGVVALDHDRDGWPDLAVANDTVRNFLFVNGRDGSFREQGSAAEMAYSESGVPRGGMGIDAGDIDGDGIDDLVIGNFAYEMTALYRGSRGLTYRDDAAPLGIGVPTLRTLAFGVLLVDLDSDGWLDLVVANGHIEPEIAAARPLQSYAQPLQVFHNQAGRGFIPVVLAGGAELPMVGRGLAAADIDGDGDLDLIVTQNGGRPRLLRNDSSGGSWLRIRPVGHASNRAGYGVRVVARQGDRRWWRTLRSGSSYLSASEAVLTIGLGAADYLDELEVTWPSGRVQTLRSPRLNQLLTVEEPTDSAPPPIPADPLAPASPDRVDHGL